MRTLIIGLLATVITLGAISSSFSDSENKSSCKRCRVASSIIVVICEEPVRNAILKLNCTGGGLFSLWMQKCYEWKGHLETGENPIQLTRFTTQEGKKFNPVEYEVRTLMVMNERFGQFSFFDFTK